MCPFTRLKKSRCGPERVYAVQVGAMTRGSLAIVVLLLPVAAIQARSLASQSDEMLRIKSLASGHDTIVTLLVLPAHTRMPLTMQAFKIRAVSPFAQICHSSPTVSCKSLYVALLKTRLPGDE